MDHPVTAPSRAGGRTFHWVLGWYLLVAAFLLLVAHDAGALALASVLLILACPLMYQVLHRRVDGDARAGAPPGRAAGGRTP